MRTVSIVLLSLLAAAPARAQWAAPPGDSLRAILATRVERGGAVGLVLGTIAAGRPLVVAAGHLDEPATPAPGATTEFEIGSISKVFTTLLLADMVVRGEVALDDPIQEFLPASVRPPSRSGRAITLLDLATASSGLPRLPDNTTFDPANPYAAYSAEDLYAFLSGYTLTRDPGAAYEYSNLGMGLLGHLLSRRLGLSYEEAVTVRILKPLGMSETFVTLPERLVRRLAPGHDQDLEPAPSWDFDVLAGAGAWKSTATDMLRFLGAALRAPEGPLGRALALATESRRPTGAPGLTIGLGWHVLDRGGDPIVWHNGGTAGYHAFIGFRPSSGANVLVLSNAAADIDDIGLHVLDPAIPLHRLPPPRPTVAVLEDVLERYVGRYQLAPTFVIEITRAGDRLYAQATGQQRFRLFAASATRFFLRALDAEVSFATDSTGRVTGLVLHQNGRESPGRKVK